MRTRTTSPTTNVPRTSTPPSPPSRVTSTSAKPIFTSSVAMSCSKSAGAPSRACFSNRVRTSRFRSAIRAKRSSGRSASAITPALAHKSLPLTACFPLADVCADQGIQSSSRRLAACADESSRERALGDLVVPHRLAGSRVAQHLLGSIQERHQADGRSQLPCILLGFGPVWRNTGNRFSGGEYARFVSAETRRVAVLPDIHCKSGVHGGPRSLASSDPSPLSQDPFRDLAVMKRLGSFAQDRIRSIKRFHSNLLDRHRTIGPPRLLAGTA